MRLSHLLILGLLLAAPGCGGQTSELGAVGVQTVADQQAPKMALTGFDPDYEAVMERIGAALGSDRLLTSATLGPPGENEFPKANPPVEAGDLYLTMRTPYSNDPIVHTRAQWQAAMALAGFWHDLQKAGHNVWGGRLIQTRDGVDLPAEEDEFGAFSKIFQPDAETFLFMNQDGETLEFDADPGRLESEIRARADDLDVTIESLTFPGAVGTGVDIELSVKDPVALLTDYDRLDRVSGIAQVGEGDDVEGLYLVVRDAEGAPVMYRALSRGLGYGICGVAPEYRQYYDCGH